jgi:hypothetical protein
VYGDETKDATGHTGRKGVIDPSGKKDIPTSDCLCELGMGIAWTI